VTKRDKLFAKIKNKPQDIRWRELVRFLESEGFSLRQGRGSRRIFSREDGIVFFVHEPHGSRPVDRGAIEKILDRLEID